MAETDLSVPFYQEVNGLILPGGFCRRGCESALSYVPRDDDFFIVTYPKCGTTWTQQIVYLIYNNATPTKTSTEFFLRSPYIEMFGRESVEKMPRPNAIKTHLPFHMVPYSSKAKYLYVTRNPKDTAISYFHNYVTDPVFTFQEGKFDVFFQDFIQGRTAYNDYFDHVLGWYKHKDDPNIMFLSYEEMKKDTKDCVLKIAKFMGDHWFRKLVSDRSFLDKVLEYSSVERMKTIFNPEFLGNVEDESGKPIVLYRSMQNIIDFVLKHKRDTDKKFNIIRKGEVGDGRNLFSEDQIMLLNKKIEEKLSTTDLYTLWKGIGCL